MFLARLGDGVTLTAAGHLPPVLVGETMRALAVRDTTWVVFDRLGVLGTRRDRDVAPTASAVALARAALRLR